MFFQAFYEKEILPQLSKKTAVKIEITGQSQPKTLLDAVSSSNLPRIYGGSCECTAQCIYSEKGPWTDILNTIDFQNK